MDKDYPPEGVFNPGEYIAELEAERDCYKEALEQYACRNNWGFYAHAEEVIWNHGEDGWRIAEQALKEAKE